MNIDFKRKLLQTVFVSAATLSILSQNATYALAGQGSYAGKWVMTA